MLTNAAIVVILAVAVYLLVRAVDVRLVLFAAALALGSLAGRPWIAFDVFRLTMANGEIIGPICSALGYSYVLKSIGADRELVRLLIAPTRRVPWLLIPGGCAVGFVTNIAIISQTACVAAVSLVLIPLMHAARYRPVIIAATLVLGCSGGNLLNPGDPDLVAIVTSTAAHGGKSHLVWNAIVVPHLLGFAAATAVLWMLGHWSPAADANGVGAIISSDGSGSSENGSESSAAKDECRINFWKAILPPLPVLMVFATWPQLGLFPSLLQVYPDGLPVTHAIIISTISAMLISRTNPSGETKGFFHGMGYGFANVISVLIVASSFIAAMKALGLLDQLVVLVRSPGPLGKVAAGFFPWLLAVISGSGTAPSVAFSQAVLPDLSAIDLTGAIDLGVIGAIAATYGRTMSPVAAVVIFTSAMMNVSPLQIVGRIGLALAAGAIVVLAVMHCR
jgi:C4-dicarboxylate transporter, DcuC family